MPNVFDNLIPLGEPSRVVAPTQPNQGFDVDQLSGWKRNGLPQVRHSPLPPAAQSQSNAVIQSTATRVVATAIAAIPAPAAPDPDMVLGVNRQLFGSIDTASQKTTNLNTVGFTFNVATAATNELAIIMGDSHIGFGGHAIDNPGGWSLITGAQAYSKVLAAAGAQSIPATYGGGFVRPAVAGLALLRTNGLAPVFTHIGGQSGGNTAVSPAFTPAAGSALIVSVDTSAQSTNPDIYHVSDTAGNAWVKLFDAYGTYFNSGAGSNYASQVVLFFCQNPANVSTVITATVLPVQSGAVGLMGTLSFDAVSNLSNLGSGSYTFQTSDNDQLVQFAGGANVAASLPSPAMATAWQCLASNNGSGVVTLSSPLLINNSLSTVAIPAGGSTWIFCDGSNYWTSASAMPLNALALTSQWLNSYDASTGIFGQSQPAFSDVSGTAVAAQIPNLDASKITTGKIALARGGTNADLSATGGASQVLKQVSSGAAVTVGQLAFSDISSVIGSGQITATAAVANQFITAISSSGVGTLAQPSFANISGTVGTGQITATGAAANQFVTAISSSGVGTLAQPAFSNLSGTASPTQKNELQATITFSATPTFDASVNGSNIIVLTGNVTSSTLTGGVAGQRFAFVIKQDGAGSHTFTWPANIKGTGTIASTINGYNVQDFIYDGSNWLAASPMQSYV